MAAVRHGAAVMVLSAVNLCIHLSSAKNRIMKFDWLSLSDSVTPRFWVSPYFPYIKLKGIKFSFVVFSPKLQQMVTAGVTCIYIKQTD